MKRIFGSRLWFLLAIFAPLFLVMQYSRADAQIKGARPERRELARTQQETINAWTVGLAGGLLEGAPIRLAAEMARVVDDGEKMHVLPVVTRGPTDNVNSLLYLRGIDAAIINSELA